MSIAAAPAGNAHHAATLGSYHIFTGNGGEFLEVALMLVSKPGTPVKALYDFVGKPSYIYEHNKIPGELNSYKIMNKPNQVIEYYFSGAWYYYVFLDESNCVMAAYFFRT